MPMRSRSWQRPARQGGVLLAGVAVALQWGCYALQPLQVEPPAVQDRAAVVLTDRGRVLLEDRVGSLVEHVDGIIASHDSAGVVVAVAGTRDVRGRTSLWSGEEITIPAEAIAGYRPRTLSKPRSILLATTTVVVITALTFGLTLDLFGIGREDGETVEPGGPGGPISFRGRGAVSLP
jgi:hypothetical protein